MKRIFLTLTVALFLLQATASEPLKIAVAGVTHSHIHQLISAMKNGDFKVVGVFEEDSQYLADNALRGLVPDSIFYGSLSKMLDCTKPEAVFAYGSIHGHMEVVEQCAPRHIHVMVEKPLAVSLKHALRMRDLAGKYNVHILTNYVTSWFASNNLVAELSKELGNIFKMEFYDGHRGPIEIGCPKRFTDWLCDPILNGGGAVVDFGCYGANLATWMLEGKEPIDVYAVLNCNKPKVYPLVDDDATIILRYPDLTVQLMASWCWPYDRLEMHLYGLKGVLHLTDPNSVTLNDKKIKAETLKSPYDNSFRYLKAVVRGEIAVKNSDLASIQNNIIVVKIIDAARRSAASGRAERLK